MTSKPRTAIIVQARFGSSRLPGKILQQLNGRSVLAHDIGRLQRVVGVDAVVIATTDNPNDDAIAAHAAACGATVFRGDEQDVLARYLGAARAVHADIVMRVTSDCPLIDPDICGAVLALRAEANADYAANNMPRLFPHGLDCEAFTRAALERAAVEATDPYDREHVTPWMRRQPGLRRANLTGPGWPANQQRWTLDFPADLAFFQAVFEHLPANRLLSWQEVLSLLGRRPELQNANRKHRVPALAATDRQAPVAVFHFSAHATIGSGHAMRCNTLQSHLETLGWRCHWAVDARTASFLEASIPLHAHIELSEGGPARQASEIATAIGTCDLLVIDHYEVHVDFARAARSVARRIVYFDDLADREMDADVIINPTPGFRPQDYAGRNAGEALCLLGPDFALLRQQFPALRQRKSAAPRPQVGRVLIAFGGVDHLDGTGVALDALANIPGVAIDVALGGGAPHLAKITAQIDALGDRARLHTDVADMAGLMAAADLVIGAPGTSTWERGCLGLPSLLVGIAENQRANAAIVTGCGAGRVAGFLTTDDRADVARTLANQLSVLMADREARQRMGAAAAGLCDGRGTQRIVTALLPLQPLPDGRELHLRLAEPADEAMLLAWQAAPETRRFALNPQVPTPDEHHAWYGRKLASTQDWLIFGEIGSEAAGYVRLDWMGEDRGRPQYLISIATAPGRHRQGIGAALLAGARALAPAANLYATVLPANTASVALFAKAGYSLATDGYYHSRPSHLEEA